ncbi:MAG: hypothetical protein EOP45_14550 [Sphingobacteriaceae bacterium]|nr:MAG: hypothetical protein EOP45_14550 [Sphingobacteriaceae bacterium]
MAILSVTSNNQPSIFVGSSKEGLSVAEAVKSNFDKIAEVDIWTENIFSLNRSTLDNLVYRASFYDYAIFVLTPDDEAMIREEKQLVSRDNVIFEFGLFLGSIGINRAFCIKEASVYTFSDFKGITISTYVSRDNIVAAVGNACNEIKRQIEVSERLYRFSLLPSTSIAIGYYINFLTRVADAFSTIEEFEVVEKDSTGKVINTQKVKVKDRFPSITILLPRKLSELQPAILKRKTHNLKQVVVTTAYRSFPFYIEGDISEDNIKFFDIPTTLLSSYETINKMFSAEFLARDNNIDKIQKREIANFEKTIRIMVSDDIENQLIKFDFLS